ncbi:hypothetical protein H4R19_002562 [Coemansia spiralis]|nr:hypothetical protein H4R19_002562 [Coemansia spiralis]
MHVNVLPDEVLERVFQAVLPAIKSRLADAKDGLELLSVCQRWRGVALPMAYDAVFIKCGTQGKSRENGPENVDITTSLDLIIGAKCCHLARELRIDLHFQADPLPGFKAAISRLREACDEWVGVRKLLIGLHLEKWVPNYRGPLAVDREDDIGSISSDLAVLLPGVREICIGGYKQSGATGELLGRLVGLYSHQLQVLHSKHALTMPQDRVFNRLRDVSIGGVFPGPCRLTKLSVGGANPPPLDLFTYTGLTHLSLSMPTSVDDVMSHIRTQPRLVSLEIDNLSLADIQADFSIPDDVEHKPVAPLDTQLRELTVHIGDGPEPDELALPMLKYLLLKTPTLRLVTTERMYQQTLRDYIDEYAQWCPHLANITLETRR